MAKQTVQELRSVAQQAVLNGLRQGATLSDIEAGVGRCRVRGTYTPDIAMLELIAAALDVLGAEGIPLLSTEGWREHHLPELTFRNRFKELNRFVYAFQAGAAARAGVLPDVLDDSYGWFDGELWPYATRAAVMTIRAAADGHDLTGVLERVARAVTPLEA